MLENPFLTRELRQLTRRPRLVQSSLLMCLLVMAALLGFWIVQRTPTMVAKPPLLRAIFDNVMIWCLVATHSVLCILAAGYGGYRFFIVEHLRSTLDSALLVPYSPAKWLALKMAFPAYLLLIAWWIGVPFWLLAKLYNLLPPGKLANVLHRPLLAGTAVLLTALIVTPDIIQRFKRQKAAAAAGERNADGQLMLFMFLVFFFWHPLCSALVIGRGVSLTPVAFYNFDLPEYAFWLLGMSAFAAAAITSALAAVVCNGRNEARAEWVKIVALGILYYLNAGRMWPDITGWWRVFLLLSFPVLLLITRYKRERREDGRAEAEVQWIANRWDNAMLIRDLRVYTRLATMRSTFLWSTVAVVLTLAFAAGYTLYSGKSLSLGLVVLPIIQMDIQIALGLWFRPKAFWTRESTSQTLTLLILTPLSSAEILGGRLMALPIYHGVGTAPLALLPFGVLVWAAVEGYWIAAPVTLALCPLLLTFGIWLSCSAGKRSLWSWQVLVGGLTTTLLRIVQTLSLAACVCLAIAGLPVAAGVGFTISPLVGWGVGVLLCVVNGLLAWAWFRVRVKQFDLLRLPDVETSMAIAA